MHDSKITLERHAKRHTGFGTADELDAGEYANSTRLKHGEAAEYLALGETVFGRGAIPEFKVLALSLLVDVVEDALLRHQQSIRFEVTLCKKDVEKRLRNISRENKLRENVHVATKSIRLDSKAG